MCEPEDEPVLSPESLLALQEFYDEQHNQTLMIESLMGNKEVNHIKFKENWQLSQFWYNKKTIKSLSQEICSCSGENGKIALISCPSLYTSIKSEPGNREVKLFEYDKRFAVYGKDYYFYDYNSPLDIPQGFFGSFDVVVADPPFLSEDCITQTAITIKFFSKSKIILCTGALLEDLVRRLLQVEKTDFQPEHENNVANEFYCYTNYKSFVKQCI